MLSILNCSSSILVLTTVCTVQPRLTRLLQYCTLLLLFTTKGSFRLPYKTVRCHASDKNSEHIFQLLRKINEENGLILFCNFVYW